ncbi:RNA polymerase sigma factor [Desertivirga arenae]|uniref:RNA polymerase sigma factor n=1 Tax=Desertivirga arenae TaxID=2810309 RepID=UPI001A97A2A0|nr:sigma-70 family RNA polymerase sigma factor [Pedobacter sp. SYSU D00823]
MIFAATDLLNKTDQEIWDLFRNGDQDAYNTLMRRYTKSLINYGFRICQDKDFAKDCVQEVFLDLWRRREGQGSVKAVKSYLFKSIRLRIYRDRSLWKQNEDLNDNEQFAIEFDIESKLIEDVSFQEMSLKIKKILNTLPPRQKEIMYLRFFENLSLDQISDTMNISKQSVNNLLQKAYKSFRSEWSLLLLILPTCFFYN